MVVARSDRLSLAILCAAAVAVLAGLWATGRLLGARPPRTRRRISVRCCPTTGGAKRGHPLYAVLAHALGGGIGVPGDVALAQALLHVAAALALYVGARLGGIGSVVEPYVSRWRCCSRSRDCSMCSSWCRQSPAISCLAFAFAGVLAGRQLWRGIWILLLPVGAATGLAYLLRPNMLPVVDHGAAAMVGDGAVQRPHRPVACGAALLHATHRLRFRPATAGTRSAISRRFVRRLHDVGTGGLHVCPPISWPVFRRRSSRRRIAS